jgi:hypothetical protein
VVKRKHKKTFPCGHRGQGQECYRCKQEAATAAQQTQAQANQKHQRDLWLASFAQDPVDLRGLPKPVVVKSRHIIEALQNGQDYRRFKGIQMRVDATLIRIPVTQDYRLIVKRTDEGLMMVEVVSHEFYNKKYGKNQRQVG